MGGMGGTAGMGADGRDARGRRGLGLAVDDVDGDEVAVAPRHEVAALEQDVEDLGRRHLLHVDVDRLAAGIVHDDAPARRVGQLAQRLAPGHAAQVERDRLVGRRPRAVVLHVRAGRDGRREHRREGRRRQTRAHEPAHDMLLSTATRDRERAIARPIITSSADDAAVANVSACRTRSLCARATPPRTRSTRHAVRRERLHEAEPPEDLAPQVRERRDRREHGHRDAHGERPPGRGRGPRQDAPRGRRRGRRRHRAADRRREERRPAEPAAAPVARVGVLDGVALDEALLPVGDGGEPDLGEVRPLPDQLSRQNVVGSHESSKAPTAAATLLRARMTHVATVPSGTPRRAAISWYCSPSRWNIVSAFRCPSGRVESA